MRLKEALSIAHKIPAESAATVAERGMLYMSANSPKLPLLSNVWTYQNGEMVKLVFE